MSLSLFCATDEPSVVLVAEHWWILAYFGSVRDWRFGFEDHTRDQNPHKQFVLGFITFGWYA